MAIEALGAELRRRKIPAEYRAKLEAELRKQHAEPAGYRTRSRVLRGQSNTYDTGSVEYVFPLNLGWPR
jgi:hypothetical protein